LAKNASDLAGCLHRRGLSFGVTAFALTADTNARR
jgi:hypothetical protein